jgi:hypothetical protein
MTPMRHLLTATALGLLLVGPAAAQDDIAAREAAVPENPLKDAFFGETHVHTSYSLDAFIAGTRLTPDDAYRFAKGETVMVSGREHDIVKPLDFAAVTDHAEFIGEMFSAQVEGALGYDNPQLVELRGLTDYADQEEWFAKYFRDPVRAGNLGHQAFYAGEETTKSAWAYMIDTATKHYDPGKFTTFVGFEWTAAPQGGNMHRNVLFRDLNVPDLPFDSITSDDEERLWDWMAAQEAAGATLLAIPHNSNASKGLMFDPVDNSGNPLDADYARRRSHFEPLIEMMQIKGNSEVVASLWPADEFADFENAEGMQQFNGRDFRKENFVRWAVTKGLDYQTRLGENPYKHGFVGGTDSHNGTPSDVVEDNYVGSHGGADNTPQLRLDGEIPGWINGKDVNPGGLTGIWAPKNTRGALYDAMRARETFAGTRIRPRFFGGAGLPAPTDPVALVTDGYAGGVPMGGDLGIFDGPPTFTVHAMKDPQGANLDRIQIIKGWVDSDGEPRERIVDVVWSGDRRTDADGNLPPVGDTVNLETAAWTNDIGAPELIGAWTDDDFDVGQPALYYVRVLEIPTPRWSTYDAVRNNLPLPDAPATIQERAWTSPIWYTPE